MKTIFRVPLALTLAVALVSMGCQQTSQQTSRSPSRAGFTSQQTSQHRPITPIAAAPAPAPVKAPAAAPAPAPKDGCVNTTSGLIHMTKTMPPEASLGSEFVAELLIDAQGCAANVLVQDSIPANATYVRSEPAATVEGNQLVWKIGNMDAGQVIKAKVWFKADKEGTIVNCAWVSADPRVCGSTFVGKALLAIDKSGPETAVIGSEVTYNIVVRNTGNAVARNVVVTDVVPAGMSHSSGKSELSFSVGDLAPGESKPMAVTFKANQRGKVCNTATANSTNAGKVSDEACTVVVVPGLKVEKTGPAEQILGRNADYQIVVSNVGDTTLSNVIVTDTAPTETSIVSATGGTVSGNKAAWTIASLAPGAKQTFTVRLTSKVAGNHCNNVTATSGGLSESAKACTLWKGIAAVLLEVVDDPDPIQVGENTAYTIRVTNQGFADIHNVKIVATFGEQITPVSTAQGSISGKNANFPTVATLAAKQVTTYTIVVKGATVGDSRNKIILTCEELKTPVEETESTTVY